MVEVIPLVDEGLGNASYLLEVGDRRALIVHPLHDVAPFQRHAERPGLGIAYPAPRHYRASQAVHASPTNPAPASEPGHPDAAPGRPSDRSCPGRDHGSPRARW
jgi:hypothetical protein